MELHFGERINDALNRITPSAFRAFSSFLKQYVGFYVPPSIWLTACVLVCCCAFYLLVRAARGPDPKP